MTKIDFNVTIDKLHCCIKTDGSVNLKMEGHVTDTGNRSQYSKAHCSCTNYQNMTNLNVSLEESANYLIQLFYNTGKRYSCTRTKIGKLLSIVAFLYARQDKRLFKEDVRKYGKCGTSFNELKAHIDRELYEKQVYQDDKKPHTAVIDRNNGLEDLDSKHNAIEKVPSDVMVFIEDVFCHFAAYSPEDLGLCINKLILHQGETNDNDKIDLLKIKTLTVEDFLEDTNPTNMDVVEFLLGI